MKLLNGVLDGGAPYTIIIESGALVFSRGAHEHAAPGPAALLDHLKAEGWQLPSEAEAWLSNLSYQGAGVVSSLIDKRGHWDLVTADDINTALKQIVDTDIQAAIHMLLLDRIKKEDTR